MEEILKDIMSTLGNSYAARFYTSAHAFAICVPREKKKRKEKKKKQDVKEREKIG